MVTRIVGILSILYHPRGFITLLSVNPPLVPIMNLVYTPTPYLLKAYFCIFFPVS